MSEQFITLITHRPVGNTYPERSLRVSGPAQALETLGSNPTPNRRSWSSVFWKYAWEESTTRHNPIAPISLVSICRLGYQNPSYFTQPTRLSLLCGLLQNSVGSGGCRGLELGLWCFAGGNDWPWLPVIDRRNKEGERRGIDPTIPTQVPTRPVCCPVFEPAQGSLHGTTPSLPPSLPSGAQRPSSTHPLRRS